MKKCPFCAEDIQEKAIVCKHCRKDLPLPQEPQKRNLNKGYSKTFLIAGASLVTVCVVIDQAHRAIDPAYAKREDAELAEQRRKQEQQESEERRKQEQEAEEQRQQELEQQKAAEAARPYEIGESAQIKKDGLVFASPEAYEQAGKTTQASDMIGLAEEIGEGIVEMSLL